MAVFNAFSSVFNSETDLSFSFVSGSTPSDFIAFLISAKTQLSSFTKSASFSSSESVSSISSYSEAISESRFSFSLNACLSSASIVL